MERYTTERAVGDTSDWEIFDTKSGSVARSSKGGQGCFTTPIATCGDYNTAQKIVDALNAESTKR